MKKLLFILGLTVLGLTSSAQNSSTLKYCGSDEAQQKVFRDNPEIHKQYLQRVAEEEKRDQEDFQRGYKKAAAARTNSVPDTVIYYIPVVFHVVHNFGPENISDAQVVDAIRILNEDYMKRNADTSSIMPTFKGRADTAFIQFILANVDPNGNCTNGIDRIISTKTSSGDDNTKMNPWPYNQYLNVWTVADIASGAAGYAYKPGTAPNTNYGSADGIEILSDYVGSIGTGSYGTARAFSHEVGHWLGLSHTWGNTNNPGVACGNDGISDTPITKGWTTCNLSNNDVCTNGVEENVQNIMEYAYCQRMFTIGQVSLMRNSLRSATGGRNNLWTTTNRSNTGTDAPAQVCAPISDFKANVKMICAGSSVAFTDLSYNATPTGWNWSFPGGSPASSSSASPSVTYNTPGTYAVTLIASSSGGSGTTTKTNYITVSSTTATLNAPYLEGFETAGSITAYNPNAWIVKTGDNIGWARTSTAYTGSGSIKLANYSAVAGDIDEAISNSVDLTSVSSPNLTFNVAYTQKTSADSDKLRVMVSTDCGRSWSQRFSKTGSTLKTTTNPQTTAFTPTSTSQWRLETVSLAAYATATNIRFKFEFTGDGGNNVYIDNINIGGVVGINTPDPVTTLNLSVFPNPLEDNSMISFNLQQKEKVKVSLIDILGRTVSSIADDEFTAGEHEIKLNHSSLKAGVYFVSLKINDRQTAFQKVLVQ